ncbi:MAG: hypothetical protein IPO81_09660 [Kouleothrix sp.]|nr:hypothetical protein [Kouleothrix sp.]
MATPTVTARLGDLYQAQLTRAAPDKTAALRGYLLLGFAGSGVDMRPYTREIQRLLNEDLAPELEAALRRLLDSRVAAAPAGRCEDAPAVLELPAFAPERFEEADPLLSVGMDF